MAHETQKIYTKTGDLGQTSLIGGKRVSKAELRLNSYGTVDELNSVIGMLIAQIFASKVLSPKKTKKLAAFLQILNEVQSSLFDIGSHLACENEKLAQKMPRIDSGQVTEMEIWIDSVNTEMKPLKNFILPGGGLPASYAHLARTVARRAERVVVALAKKTHVDSDIIIYLNRLSDFLFIASRYLNFLEKIEDVIWSAKKK